MTETPKIEPGLYAVRVLGKPDYTDTVEIATARPNTKCYASVSALRPLPPALSEADEAVLKAAREFDVAHEQRARSENTGDVVANTMKLMTATQKLLAAVRRTPSPAPDVAKGWVPKVGDRVRVKDKYRSSCIVTDGIVVRAREGSELVCFQSEPGGAWMQVQVEWLEPIAPPAADVAKLERDAVVEAAKEFRVERLRAGDVPLTAAGRKLLATLDALLAAEGRADPVVELVKAARSILSRPEPSHLTGHVSVEAAALDRLEAALAKATVRP